MIRVVRSGGYTVLPNGILWDKRLSRKTKGLFAVILSLLQGGTSTWLGWPPWPGSSGTPSARPEGAGTGGLPDPLPGPRGEGSVPRGATPSGTGPKNRCRKTPRKIKTKKPSKKEKSFQLTVNRLPKSETREKSTTRFKTAAYLL